MKKSISKLAIIGIVIAGLVAPATAAGSNGARRAHPHYRQTVHACLQVRPIFPPGKNATVCGLTVWVRDPRPGRSSPCRWASGAPRFRRMGPSRTMKRKEAMLYYNTDPQRQLVREHTDQWHEMRPRVAHTRRGRLPRLGETGGSCSGAPEPASPHAPAYHV